MPNTKFDLLEYLWYIIPGAFLVLPINIAAIAAAERGLTPEINVLLAFALGYIVHQIFRKRNHKRYALGDRPAIHFLEEKTLSDEKIKRDIGRINNEERLFFLDLVYNYCIFSNPEFEHRINFVKRKSFFSVAAGVSSYGLLLGGCLLSLFVCLELFGILPPLKIGNMSYIFGILMIISVTAMYFSLSYCMKKYHEKLEKVLNSHESTLIGMKLDEIKKMSRKLIRDETYLKEIEKVFHS